MMPEAAPAPTSTALEDRLITLIGHHGPITVGDFMQDALSHSQHGYYTTQNALGTEGDFTTAPEISQIFGELIGAWLINAWESIGAPSLVNLVELGPGRGTLMADILRVGKVRPDFLKAARVYMVENAGRMRVRQQSTLKDKHEHITWVDKLQNVPSAPTLIIANEFFDCLPIRQFVRTANNRWRERLVGVNDEGPQPRLCFVLSKDTYNSRPGIPDGARPEAVFEESPIAQEIVRAIAERFENNKGRALIIDYGHGRSGFGDTFQAVQRHSYCHPLTAPGEVDVTAHVDFAAIGRTGRDARLRVDGPVRQGDFLQRLGLTPRLEALTSTASADQREGLISGAKRLVDVDAMGSLFKVMALSSRGSDIPPGFE